MLAGSDTNCCMSFGSGKNNIYNFNPNCAIFTVQESKADGSYRTIAQSVLTLDLDIKTAVSTDHGESKKPREDVIKKTSKIFSKAFYGHGSGFAASG